ncbi:MAG TPA: RICIN domain-containing protein [Candidatus Methylacidiphilales bacterium]|nr:RICIN domain-containing protein [Candidatus Methylacidiphilales bacterium]
MNILCPHCQHEYLLTRQFKDFLLERQVGSGGIGSVYLATDISLNRVVVVKVLRHEVTSDPKFMAAFVRQAQATASLTHPNTAHVYAFGKQGETHYLVVEYVSGGSLADKIINRGRISEIEALNIGLAAAHVLQSALLLGLLHQNIKPTNILFANNVPKVVDFGLSLTFETMEHFDSKLGVWGGPYYIPPEKLDNQPEDFRSDIYSLGVTLYHGLAGHPPFEGKDAIEVGMKHLKGDLAPLHTVAPKVSEKTSSIISKAMARNPDDRYQSYAALIEDLEEARSQFMPSLSPKKEPLQEVGAVNGAKAKSNLALIVGLVVLVVLLTLGGVVAGLFVFGKGKIVLFASDTGPNTQATAPANPLSAPQSSPAAPAPHTIKPPRPHKTVRTVPLPIPPFSPPPGPGIDFNGYSQIVSKSSGLYVAVQGAAKENHTFIIQSANLDPSDQWEITRLTNGHYKISNHNSGKAMAVQLASLEPGAPIWQANFNSKPNKPHTNDEWFIVPTSNNNYGLINACSQMALEVKGSSTVSGASLDQEPWTGADNQQFKIVNTPTTSSPAGSAPTTRVPTASTPATTAPAVSTPTTSVPTVSTPATTAPAVSAPTTRVPDASAPATNAP